MIHRYARLVWLSSSEISNEEYGWLLCVSKVHMPQIGIPGFVGSPWLTMKFPVRMWQIHKKTDFLPWIKVGWCWCLSHSTQVLWRRVSMCWYLVVSSWYEHVSECGTWQISLGHGEFPQEQQRLSVVSIWVATLPCSKNIFFLQWGSDQWRRVQCFSLSSTILPWQQPRHVQPLEQLTTSAQIPQPPCAWKVRFHGLDQPTNPEVHEVILPQVWQFVNWPKLPGWDG